MTVKIEIFTSPTCPNCPSAIMLAKAIEKERDDVKVVETSTMTKNGSKRARMFEIFSVPTIFVNGPKFDRIGFRGTPPKTKLLDAIDISLGIKQWEEPKTLAQKIKEKLPIKIKW